MRIGIFWVGCAWSLFFGMNQAAIAQPSRPFGSCGSELPVHGFVVNPDAPIDKRSKKENEVLTLLLDQVVEIPVVVHLVNSELDSRQVRSQIDALNRDYRALDQGLDTKIQFCLAEKDPIDQRLVEPGLDRVRFRNEVGASAKYINYDDIQARLKPATIWDPHSYLNIWVVPAINDPVLGVLGISVFPVNSGLPGLTPGTRYVLPESYLGTPTTDGVVIAEKVFGSNDFEGGAFKGLYPGYDNGKTTSHEVGHWLGLFHTFEGYQCDSSPDEGDFCADTPATDTPTFNCEHPASHCTPGPMVENFMDYTGDSCKWRFTEDQLLRMKTTLSVADFKKDIPYSHKCHADWDEAARPYEMFPNPSYGKVTIRVSDPQITQVWMHDLAGRVLLKKSLEGVFSALTVDLSSLPSGTYVVSFAQADGKVIHEKLLKP